MTESVGDDRQALLQQPFPTAAMQQCPYPYYAALRDTGPLRRLPGGEYVVSRHADVAYVLHHPELFSSRHSMFDDGWTRAATLEDLGDPSAAWGIVNSDPPMHGTKRRLAMEMFKPGRMQQYSQIVKAHVSELVDGFLDRGECEFVSEYADLLPAKVTMSLFDLPPQDLDRVLEWRKYEGFGTRYASPERRAAARDSILDMSAYIRDLVVERAAKPGQDELSAHIQRHMVHHGRLDVPNIVAEASNLFIGGIITTTHLLGTSMMLFIQNPEQQVKARASEEGLRNAIEEALRIDAPVQLSMRLVTEKTTLNGAVLEPGTILIVLIGSANRDEDVFAHPDEFDLDRPNLRSHLAFGSGHHLCIGARLGRLELYHTFQYIFAKTSNLRFAPEAALENLTAVMYRGLQELQIRFDRV